MATSRINYLFSGTVVNREREAFAKINNIDLILTTTLESITEFQLYFLKKIIYFSITSSLNHCFHS